MEIFEDHKKGRKQRKACSYCREEGHNKNDCPHALDDWNNGWKDFKVPLTTTRTKVTYYRSPRYWGEWYTKCKELVEHQAHLEQQGKNKKKRQHKLLKDKRCGFCGEKGHTRRTCELKKNFLDDCYKANENWRKAAYDYLVNRKGISVGAIIKVRTGGYYGNTWVDKIATIKSINWHGINLFCSSSDINSSWGNELKASLEIHVIVDGEVRKLSQYHYRGWGEKDKAAPKKMTDGKVFAHECLANGYGGQHQFVSVLSRAKKEITPDEAWVSESYKEAFEYLAKKRSHEKIKNLGGIGVIEVWK